MSESVRDVHILEHIVDYCDQISLAVEHFGDSFEIFDRDKVYRNSVSMCILQIGELVGILSDEFKSAHDNIPWTQIKKMRNIVAHRYGTVDSEITWQVVKEDIPNLRQFCEAVLSDSILNS